MVSHYFSQLILDSKLIVFYLIRIFEDTSSLIDHFITYAGWTFLLKQFFYLIALIITPYFIFKLSQALHKKIKALKRHVYFYQKRNESLSVRLMKKYSFCLNHLTFIFTAYIIKKILMMSFLSHFGFVCNYFLLYGYMKLVFSIYLEYFSSTKQLTPKHTKTLTLWSWLIFTSFAISGFILQTAGPNTLFMTAQIIALMTIVICYFISCYKWRDEVKNEVTLWPYIGDTLNTLFAKTWYPILSIILTSLIFLQTTLAAFLSFFDEFDFFKKMSNLFFKTRLSEMAMQSQKAELELPPKYSCRFNEQSHFDEACLISPQSYDHLNALSPILNWDKDHEQEHSLIVVGPSGSGKSTFINQLKKQFPENLTTLTYRFKGKITKPAGLDQVFTEIFQRDFAGGMKALKELDENITPTVVILDDLHHIFLGTEDGFEALKYFIHLISADTKNIFWVSTMNSHAWLYINNVLGRNQHFRHEVSIPKWNDHDLTNMIEKRHGGSEYSLSFDLMMNGAEQAQDQGEIKKQFFQFLTQASRGLPKAALSLWMSSIKATSYQKLQVALPYDLSTSKMLGDLQDHFLFVYAALLRHECLNLSEASRVTSLPRGVVASALKIGVERKFLTKNKSARYSPQMQSTYLLTSFLMKKNFIYE